MVIEVIDVIEAAAGIRFERQYKEARKTDINVSSFDISLACKVLFWSPRTPFQIGIEETLAGRFVDVRRVSDPVSTSGGCTK